MVLCEALSDTGNDEVNAMLMMRCVPLSLLSIHILFLSLLHAGSAEGKPATFEVHDLTLYDIGVMQVRKEASVDGQTELRLPVLSAHLDDVLNSLLLTTDENVQVTSVDYPMVKNIAQALAAGSIGQSVADEDGFPAIPTNFSQTMKLYIGVNVRLHLKGTSPRQDGTILGVVEDDSESRQAVSESRMTDEGGTPIEPQKIWCVVLLSANSNLLKIPLSDILTVELKSTSEATALRSLATELGKSNGFEEKEITIRIEKGSTGHIAANYVQQSPRWRMWYRLYRKADGLWLEGWAQVHNDTVEDWHHVKMTLVSASPDSYLVSVASPRYGSRDSLELANSGEMMPQLGPQTVDRLLYDYHSGLGYMSGSGSGSGYGSLGGRRSGTPAIGRGKSSRGDGSSALIDIGESAAKEMAEAAVDAEISTYRVLKPVSIRAGSSSMVPVLNRKISGQLFSRIDPHLSAVNTCARLENTTGTVLQSGLISVYVNGHFRGHSELARTEPNSPTVICYGVDEDVTYEKDDSVLQSDTRRLEWDGDHLYAHNFVKREHRYQLENKSGEARTLGIVVHHMANGRVVSELSFVSSSDMPHSGLAFVTVAARDNRTVLMNTEEGVREVTDTQMSTLKKMLRKKTLPGNEQRILEDIIKNNREIQRLEKQSAENMSARGRIEKSIQTDRTNMASLPRMRGRSRIARKILASILEKSAEMERLDMAQDTLNRQLRHLRAAPQQLLMRLNQ